MLALYWIYHCQLTAKNSGTVLNDYCDDRSNDRYYPELDSFHRDLIVNSVVTVLVILSFKIRLLYLPTVMVIATI